MRKRISMFLAVLLAAAVLAGCAGETPAAFPAALEDMAAVETVQPTEPLRVAAYTETEPVYDANNNLQQLTERVYNSDDILIEERHTEYHSMVNIITIKKYSDSGILIEESQMQEHDGQISFLHLQQYTEDGVEVLSRHEEYFSDGETRVYMLTERDTDGTVLKDEYLYVNSDRSLADKSSYVLDTATGIAVSKGESYLEDGSLEFFWDKIVDGASGTMLDGRDERYYENGTLWILKEADLDEQNRTRTASETRYSEDGTETLAWLWTEQLDEAGNVLLQDYVSYGYEHVFNSHSATASSYDDAGNALTKEVTYYQENGQVKGKASLEYAYNSQGAVIWENNITRTASGKQESRSETSYTYNAEGVLTQREYILYDETDAETYRDTEEYDDQGRTAVRSSMSPGHTQTDTYTYLEDGKQHTVLTSTTSWDEGEDPEEAVTEYQKVTMDYYENGQMKTQTVQTWTSEDEKRAAPGTDPSKLGKTYVAQFDENGNRI